MDKRFVSFLKRKDFLFIGNLAASIVQNVSTQAEEQPLCKTYTRRSELFRTNGFWRVDKASDEIKPHNKKQEIPQQLLIVLTFFIVNLFYYSSCNRLQRVLLENKVILQIWQSRGNLFVMFLFWRAVNLQMNRTVKYQGAFSRIVGFAGKRFLFSPPPPTFFCLRSNFCAITRLETLATQAS